MGQIAENQVSVIHKSLDLIKTGPEILIASQSRRDKAVSVGSNILSSIQEKGMNSETDERAKNYLINIATAAKEIKDGRVGITQIMDQLKTMYTEVENSLDVKKQSTIPWQIQEHRNKYAAQVAAENERKRKEIERAASKSKEAVEIKYGIEKKYKDAVGTYLLNRKQSLQKAFNEITLDVYEQKAISLRGMVIKCEIPTINLTYPAIYHTNDEVDVMANTVVAENEHQLKSDLFSQLGLLKQDLIDKLPSKLKELQEEKRLADEAEAEKERSRVAEEKRQAEIKKTKDAEAKLKLEQEATKQREAEQERQKKIKEQQEQQESEKKKREQEDEIALKKKAEEDSVKQNQDQEVRRQGDHTMVMFETEAAIAENKPAPETREGYEIKILHPVGYTQIFALWFEQEGKNLPVDKIGNTKLDQMKAWAEKKAQKEGTKIESKFLSYEPTYRAINRSAKK